MTALQRRAGLSRCGRRYATQADAEASAALRIAKGSGPLVVRLCPLWACGWWHIESAEPLQDTGPSARDRARVLRRDRYACVCCGVSVIGRRYSLGHRLRASQGGKPVPSNLLVFLGWGGEACHGRIDSRRDPADEAKGYTVRSHLDPSVIPVTDWTGATYWLTDDGGKVYERPAGAA